MIDRVSLQNMEDLRNKIILTIRTSHIPKVNFVRNVRMLYFSKYLRMTPFRNSIQFNQSV